VGDKPLQKQVTPFAGCEKLRLKGVSVGVWKPIQAKRLGSVGA
jgi:hypothetical protein